MRVVSGSEALSVSGTGRWVSSFADFQLLSLKIAANSRKLALMQVRWSAETPSSSAVLRHASYILSAKSSDFSLLQLSKNCVKANIRSFALPQCRNCPSSSAASRPCLGLTMLVKCLRKDGIR